MCMCLARSGVGGERSQLIHPGPASSMTKFFCCVESIMRVNAASLDIRDATTSTPGTLNDLTTDLIMANNNNNRREGEWMRGLGLGFTNPVGTGSVGRVSVLRWCRWEMGRELGPGSGGVVW